MIHFPLYDNVDELWIGIEKNATLQEGGQYRSLAPVIYYGSSITQGGCASRPGNAYPAIISRQLNCDFRNLGFSGSSRGEQISAQYIAEQPMCVFVMDLFLLKQVKKNVYYALKHAGRLLKIGKPI